MSQKQKCKQCANSPINQVYALAKELGWTNLNDDEKRLIKTLRHTTWHGRALVMEIASSVRTQHPWTDDGSPLNTTSPLISSKEG